ncbi:unnamed protein product [Allacma fusca]|uniref:Glycine-rich protein n=1 Tax=Allacma fusca TaxID=39272 RepID=A0A8J2L2N6_9HEXA|nr:unnamed protein product [Allacma fusca]
MKVLLFITLAAVCFCQILGAGDKDEGKDGKAWIVGNNPYLSGGVVAPGYAAPVYGAGYVVPNYGTGFIAGK